MTVIQRHISLIVYLVFQFLFLCLALGQRFYEKSFKARLAAFAVPLFFMAFLITLKALYLPNCYAFDLRDESNHTFVNQFIAQDHLRHLQLPLINLYTNFGTVFLGDALTYPFGVHSLTYWFLQPPVAMTVNRFVICIITLALLVHFFKKYMSLFSSVVCSFLTFTSPGVFWHFAHHHYQMSMAFFVSGLILLEKWVTNPTRWRTTALFALLCMLILSVSINIVVIMLGFFMAYLLIEGWPESRSRLWRFGLLIMGAFLFSFPQTAEFLKAAVASARNHQVYGDQFTWGQILNGMAAIFLLKTQRDASYNFSIPVIVMCAAGVIWASRDARSRRIASKGLWLGLVPIFPIAFLLVNPSILALIPLFRSTDITRFWWFSCLFMVLPVGYAMDRLFMGSLQNHQQLGLLGGSFLITAAYICFGKWDYMFEVFKAPVYLFNATLMTFLALKYLQGRLSSVKSHLWALLGMSVLAGSLMAGRLPLFNKVAGLYEPFVCRTSHYFSEAEDAVFQPQSFLSSIQPFSRLATSLNSMDGQDSRVGRYNIFGSNGYMTLLNGRLANYLIKEGLVEIDNFPMAYHFIPPWRKDKLRDLGIKYIIQDDERSRVDMSGWQLKAKNGSLSLYENPLPISVVYLSKGSMRMPLGPENCRFEGNNVFVKLPKRSQDLSLTAAFEDIPGWKVYVDGKRRSLERSLDPFLHIDVKAEDSRVVFSYQPFTWLHVVAGVAGSLGILYLTFYDKRMFSGSPAKLFEKPTLGN